MDNEQEDFAVGLTDQCGTHQEWLAVVRFGLGTLLENQPLLIEIITREACRQAKKSKAEAHVPADFARTIMGELGLRLVMTDN